MPYHDASNIVGQNKQRALSQCILCSPPWHFYHITDQLQRVHKHRPEEFYNTKQILTTAYYFFCFVLSFKNVFICATITMYFGVTFFKELSIKLSCLQDEQVQKLLWCTFIKNPWRLPVIYWMILFWWMKTGINLSLLLLHNHQHQGLLQGNKINVLYGSPKHNLAYYHYTMIKNNNLFINF